MAVLTVLSDVETDCLPAAGLTRTWVEAVSRAHAILTQDLPDELLDEIASDHAARPPFTLPPVLFG